MSAAREYSTKIVKIKFMTNISLNLTIFWCYQVVYTLKLPIYLAHHFFFIFQKNNAPTVKDFLLRIRVINVGYVRRAPLILN